MGCLGAESVDFMPRFLQHAGMTALEAPSRSAIQVARRLIPLSCLALFILFSMLTGHARAQAPTVDTSVPALPGGTGSLMGQAPGSGGGLFINLPGTGGILGGRAGVSTPKGIPTSISSPGTGAGPADLQMPISAPQPAPIAPSEATYYGSMELAQESMGPAKGVTLDRAIDVALERSMDLKSKFFEIPMAKADMLQANLRSNPVFYQDGQLLQYRGTSTAFNRAAPGGPSQFDTNITYPLDVSRKRQARTVVASRAERVLEAQYQDAVRQRIDDVYGAFVTALAARQTLLYATQSVAGLKDLAARNEQKFLKGDISQGDLNQIRIRLRNAELGVFDSKAAYRKAKLDLGSLMNLKLDEIASLEIRGAIQDFAPPPPPVEELRKIALADRPDIASMRLGVSRAEADVRLAKANAYNDVFVLWQPYTFQDNSPYGLKSQYSWALGVTVPLPLYNRNQGGIARAKINVSQSQMQLSDLERQIVIDVEEAIQEYEVSRRLVDELQDEVNPKALQVRNEVRRLYEEGAKSIPDYLDAQLAYNQVVKQYLDTAVRHRRSMLSLNTVLGRRIMP